MAMKRPMVAFLTQLLLAVRSRFTRRAGACVWRIADLCRKSVIRHTHPPDVGLVRCSLPPRGTGGLLPLIYRYASSRLLAMRKLAWRPMFGMIRTVSFGRDRTARRTIGAFPEKLPRYVFVRR